MLMSNSTSERSAEWIFDGEKYQKRILCVVRNAKIVQPENQDFIIKVTSEIGVLLKAGQSLTESLKTVFAQYQLSDSMCQLLTALVEHAVKYGQQNIPSRREIHNLYNVIGSPATEGLPPLTVASFLPRPVVLFLIGIVFLAALLAACYAGWLWGCR